MRVGRTCTADHVVTIIEALVAESGAPDISTGTMSRTHRVGAPRLVPTRGAVTNYIERDRRGSTPSSKVSTVASAPSSSTSKWFASLLEAQVLTEPWRVEYITHRPHSSVGGLALATYAER